MNPFKKRFFGIDQLPRLFCATDDWLARKALEVKGKVGRPEDPPGTVRPYRSRDRVFFFIKWFDGTWRYASQPLLVKMRLVQCLSERTIAILESAGICLDDLCDGSATQS